MLKIPMWKSNIVITGDIHFYTPFTLDLFICKQKEEFYIFQKFWWQFNIFKETPNHFP